MDGLKAKNILVTGGGGFIGSHLVDELIERGHNVVVIDNLSSGKRENINLKARFYKADVRDKNIFQILEREKIDGVFHLAAQPIVEKAYENPVETLETNIMGTVNVLEACRQKGDLKFVVVISSDKAYGRTKELPYKEFFPLKGSHPYDVSKSAADLIAQAFFSTYGLPVVITRFSNVYGPRDFNFSRIIPGALEAAIKDAELAVRSDGKMVREYVYVKDIIDGCIKLAQNIEIAAGEAFNFGSTNIYSVIDVINRIEKILGQTIKYNVLNIAKNEIPAQYLDWSKAKEKLNWVPIISFEDGIAETYLWYKEYFKN
ncbi:MAG: GDP-mannose 4,6-dehydratase [Patescibacteria group bacterium]